MRPNVTATLRKALGELETEKARLEQQIAAIRSLIGGPGKPRGAALRAVPRRPKATRRTMSAAARKAISQRMKESWAKRKMAKAKGASQAAK